jgi:putative addiction module component (TIGR02574 family)
MIVVFSATLKQVESWPPEERMRFVEAVWDRLILSGFQPELSASDRQELDRRLDLYEKEVEAGRPWREVLDDLKLR